MKRAKFFRILTASLILLADLLILPMLLLLPLYVRRHGFEHFLAEWRKLNPFHAFSSVLADGTLLKSFLLVQPLVIVLIVFIFLKDTGIKNRIAGKIGGPPAAGSGQFGTSRWQTPKETDKTSMVWPFRKIVPHGGTVMGVDIHRGIAWVDPNDVNTLIVGATRSGKTRRLVMPTIWMLAHAGESLLITDPKGELYQRSSKFLRKMGYRIKVVDFRKPGWGNFWNPMEPVIQALERNDVAEANKHAWSIANMFVYQRPGSDRGEPIWRDGAEAIIASLILAVGMEAPRREMKHMYSVYKMLAELGQTRKVILGGSVTEFVPLSDYIQSLPIDHPARDAYAAAALAPERTRGSFFTNVTTLLRLFADPSIRYLTSRQDHALDEVGMEKTAVFLIVPDEDKTRHTLAALYVDQTYQALVNRANQTGGRLPIRVNFLLDEFGNMPPLKDLDTKVTVSLGRGIRWNLILQDFAQLETAYGERVSRTIRGNCHTLIYLLTTDEDTAAKISRRLGRYTVESESSSYNVGIGRSQISRGGSSGLTGRDLLTPDEILRWPEDRALIIRARHNPANLPLPDLSLLPADQDLEPSEEVEEPRKVDNVESFVPNLSNPSKTNEFSESDSQEEDFLFMSQVD